MKDHSSAIAARHLELKRCTKNAKMYEQLSSSIRRNNWRNYTEMPAYQYAEKMYNLYSKRREVVRKIISKLAKKENERDGD